MTRSFDTFPLELTFTLMHSLKIAWISVFTSTTFCKLPTVTRYCRFITRGNWKGAEIATRVNTVFCHPINVNVRLFRAASKLPLKLFIDSELLRQIALFCPSNSTSFINEALAQIKGEIFLFRDEGELKSKSWFLKRNIVLSMNFTGSSELALFFLKTVSILVLFLEDNFSFYLNLEDNHWGSY